MIDILAKGLHCKSYGVLRKIGYRLRWKIRSKYCFMKQKSQIQMNIAQNKHTAHTAPEQKVIQH